MFNNAHTHTLKDDRDFGYTGRGALAQMEQTN